MIHNAILTQIDKYLGLDPLGNPAWEPGPEIRVLATFIKVGVLFQDSASANQLAHPNVGRLLVCLADLASPEAILMNDRLTVTPDASPKRKYIVNYAWLRVAILHLPHHLELDLRDENCPAKLPNGA